MKQTESKNVNSKSRLRKVIIIIAIFIFAGVGTALLLMSRAEVGCTGVNIAAGANIQAVIDANPAGTTYCLAAGTYRNQTIKPKSGDTIAGAGQTQTILDGANLITSFGRSGSLYTISNQTQENFRSGECESGYPVCNRPEILYMNNVPFTGVDAVSKVTTNTFYFDYAANVVYFANDPTGKTVEIGNTNKAIIGQRPAGTTSGGATNVTIRDLTVEKYAQTAQQAAIETNDNWLILRVTSQLNGGQGITLLGKAPKVSYSRVLQNGQIGIGANGGNGSNTYGGAVYPVYVDNTEIAYNNINHYEAGWEAGGTKFWSTNGSIISHNWVHHNRGPGLWDDGFNDNITFDANQVEDNMQNGIFHEIGLKATITNNLIQRNGGTNANRRNDPIQGCWTAICISSGKNVTIKNNYIYDNTRGIVLVDDPHYPDPTNQVTISDNVVRDSGDQAVAESLPSYQLAGGSFKDFPINNNHYTNTMQFGFNQAARSWSEWQAYGKDPNGQYASSATIASQFPTITTAGIQTVNPPASTDTAAPVVSLGTPLTSGATVSGSVAVNANASDNVGVSKVEIYIDNTLVATDTTSPYTYTWDTTKTSNASHTVSVKAYDAAGNIGTATVTVTVDNSDKVSPSVNLTAPTNGSTVSSTVNAAATATDNTGVAKVDFVIDGTVAKTATTGPYTYSWDTTKTTNGTHAVTAKAYDAAGNVASSSASVNVSNADKSAPTAPSNLTATSTDGLIVKLNWTASTDNVGVTNYYIMRDSVFIARVDGKTTSFTDSTLPGITYKYQVVADDIAGNLSPLSNEVTIKTPPTNDTTAPTKATFITSQLVSPTVAYITWGGATDNVGIVSYDVYRNNVKFATVDATSEQYQSFGDGTLTAGNTYSYYVVARDASGNVSPPSKTTQINTGYSTSSLTTASTGALVGVVSDSNTKAPLAGATVSIGIKGVRTIVTTNSQGAYTITGIPAATKNPNYAKTGYYSQSASVVITAGQVTTQNMSLVPKP